jgi:hypothetical protein
VDGSEIDERFSHNEMVALGFTRDEMIDAGYRFMLFFVLVTTSLINVFQLKAPKSKKAHK